MVFRRVYTLSKGVVVSNRLLTFDTYPKSLQIHESMLDMTHLLSNVPILGSVASKLK